MKVVFCHVTKYCIVILPILKILLFATPYFSWDTWYVTNQLHQRVFIFHVHSLQHGTCSSTNLYLFPCPFLFHSPCHLLCLFCLLVNQLLLFSSFYPTMEIQNNKKFICLVRPMCCIPVSDWLFCLFCFASLWWR